MTINVSKVTCETKTTKIEPMSNSKPHAYFIEHLVCVIEKHHKNATRNQKTQAFDPMAQEQDPTTRSGVTNKASWRIFAGIKTCSRKKNQNGELDMRRRKLDSKNKALTRHGPNVGDYSPHGEGDDGRIERWALQNRAARHIRGS
jgi:hypothetical protein